MNMDSIEDLFFLKRVYDKINMKGGILCIFPYLIKVIIHYCQAC